MIKTITLIFIVLVISVTKSFAQDAFITDLTLSLYVQAGGDYPMTVNLQNNSGPNITSATITWELDNNGVANPESFNIGGGGLPSGPYYVNLPLSPDLIGPAEGAHTIKVWVDAPGDTIHSNDTITFSFTALSNFASKVVLFEEGTAQWCPHCPPAGNVSDSLEALPDVAVTRFHNTDDLSFTEGEEYFARYFGSSPTEAFPAGMVDMSEYGNYVVNSQYTNWPGDVGAQTGVSPVLVTMTTSIDDSTRELTVVLTSNFKYSEKSVYGFNAFVLESGIVGYQIQPSGARVNEYVHNNVVRAILGGLEGSVGIPPTPVVNTDYSITYRTTIPTTWNMNNLSVVGVVFKVVDNETEALNAVKSTVVTGVNNVTAKNNISVYPNPFTDGVTLNIPENNHKVSVSVFSVDGKLLFRENYAAVNSGLLYVDLKDRNLAPGFYTMNIITDSNSFSKKLIKN